jgi:hypothetical protein
MLAPNFFPVPGSQEINMDGHPKAHCFTRLIFVCKPVSADGRMSRSFKRPLYYILKDGKPVPESDPRVINAFLRDSDKRRVAETFFQAPDGVKICIATVFLCVDCGHLDDGHPVLWETRIFWSGHAELHCWQKRYTSEAEARTGHQGAAALVQATVARLRRFALFQPPPL